MQKLKIALVTSCGNKKHDRPLPAWQLYKSPRIKALYKRKGKYDMYILSAQHGLLPAEKVIETYDRKMNLQRSEELKQQLKSILSLYDVVVYFKAGSNKLYAQCIEATCKESNLKLISFGNRCMEGIGYVDEILKLCEKQRFLEISN